MITLQDCMEVPAITEHAHIREIAGAALGRYFVTHEHGAETNRDMLRDDIASAIDRGDRPHAHEIFIRAQGERRKCAQLRG